MEPRPHDLLRLDLDAFELPGDAPAWASRGRRALWVVVRRAVAAPGMAAVGVRGVARRERWALCVPLSCVRERVTPEALAEGRRWTALPAARRELPAFAALGAAADLLGGLAWGPGGSVGYELASGLPVVTEGSDLDLILRSPLPRAEAGKILDVLAALPARADAQLDTGHGSFALSEWAAGREVLLRRAAGPILTADPWAEPARPAAHAATGTVPS